LRLLGMLHPKALKQVPSMLYVSLLAAPEACGQLPRYFQPAVSVSLCT
jgi:hypothetical protein